MKDFFSAIESFFNATMLHPLDSLRALELQTWFGANLVSWIFIAIGFAGFVYWMLQLKKFDDNKEDDKSITAHPYL